MKKGLVTILSVAILGVIGMSISKKPASTASLAVSSQAATSSSTSGSVAASSTTSGSTGVSTSSKYKDGTYTASSDTPYGTVKIAVVISGGKINGVQFLEMPSDQGHSREVTAYAEPLLKQATLQAQSPNIDFVSGATSTSYGYEQSLQAALDKAVTA